MEKRKTQTSTMSLPSQVCSLHVFTPSQSLQTGVLRPGHFTCLCPTSGLDGLISILALPFILLSSWFSYFHSLSRQLHLPNIAWLGCAQCSPGNTHTRAGSCQAALPQSWFGLGGTAKIDMTQNEPTVVKWVSRSSWERTVEKNI